MPKLLGIGRRGGVRPVRKLLYATVAGAAGTMALNAVTYLDMAARGRPASPVPEQGVERLAEATGVGLGDQDKAANRRAGLGPLLGMANGLAAAGCYALLTRDRVPAPAGGFVLTGMAMVASNLPLMLSGLTDVREWSREDWLADVVPHLAYGLVTAKTYALLIDASSRSRRDDRKR